MENADKYEGVWIGDCPIEEQLRRIQLLERQFKEIGEGKFDKQNPINWGLYEIGSNTL